MSLHFGAVLESRRRFQRTICGRERERKSERGIFDLPTDRRCDSLRGIDSTLIADPAALFQGAFQISPTCPYSNVDRIIARNFCIGLNVLIRNSSEKLKSYYERGARRVKMHSLQKSFSLMRECRTLISFRSEYKIEVRGISGNSLYVVIESRLKNSVAQREILWRIFRVSISARNDV